MKNRTTHRTLVFDGDCVLCSSWVGFVLRHDREGVYRFAAVQSSAGRDLLLAHGIDPDDPLSFLLLDDERGYTETTGIIRVLRSFGGLWKVCAGLLGVVPRFVRDPVYRWIARHRYRIFGRRDRCLVPDPNQAHRFLD